MNSKILMLLAFILPIWAGKAQNLVNQGTLKINAGTTLRIAGNLTNNSAAGNLDNAGDVRIVGNFTQTNSATYSNNGAVYLEGTTEQTLSSATPLAIHTLQLNNSTGAKLSNDLTIVGSLTLTNGDLDLNGKNITLNGTLVEDRANNHLVKDLTATGESNQGGGIIFTGTVTDATGEMAGTGLHLQGATGANYGVNVIRKHYQGAYSSQNKGIKRIYQITGTPNQPTTMRIYYANDELAGITGIYRLYRWESTTGWKNANNGGAFANGTNGMDYAEATGINAFSHWTVGTEEAPLPITLLGLKGTRVEGLNGEPTEEVKLEWTTASEINNKGFEVEMSENGLAYEKIDFVDGANNSSTPNNYQLTTINQNDSYYRLKQIDFDGTFSYSPIVFVAGLAGKVVVYPNPSNGIFTINVGKGKLDLPARLFNAQGVESPLTPEGGIYKVSNLLPAGMYFLHTVVAGKVKVTKIVIEH